MRKITMTTPSKQACVNATTYIMPMPLLATFVSRCRQCMRSPRRNLYRFGVNIPRFVIFPSGAQRCTLHSPGRQERTLPQREVKVGGVGLEPPASLDTPAQCVWLSKVCARAVWRRGSKTALRCVATSFRVSTILVVRAIVVRSVIVVVRLLARVGSKNDGPCRIAPTWTPCPTSYPSWDSSNSQPSSISLTLCRSTPHPPRKRRPPSNFTSSSHWPRHRPSRTPLPHRPNRSTSLVIRAGLVGKEVAAGKPNPDPRREL